MRIIKEGQSVYIPFVNGESVLDSQNRPRMYKSIEQFKKSYPGFRIKNPKLVEYAPVVYGKVKVSEESVGVWVRVDDRIPDAEQEVILCCVTPSGYTYQCQGFYVPTGMYRDDSEYCYDLEFCEEYDEEKDDFIVNPGWYERIYNLDEYSAVGIHDKVTHWMPLNNFPK